jgi:FADH2 O2-dependent halogenase
MLPLAAYTLDALHSSGNAHTLYGIERLVSIFERGLSPEEFYAALQEHARTLQTEIELIDQLVHGCYRAFVNFDLFVSFAMFYFAAAHNSEDQRRRGLAGPGSAFLLAGNAQFRAAVDTCYDRLLEITAAGPPTAVDVRDFRELVTRSIEPFNIAGLCDESRHNMYPFIVPA